MGNKKLLLIISIVIILVLIVSFGLFNYIDYNKSKKVEKVDSVTELNNVDKENIDSIVEENNENAISEEEGNTIYDNIIYDCKFRKKDNVVLCNIKNTANVTYTIHSADLRVDGIVPNESNKIEIPVNKTYSLGDEDTFEFKTNFDTTKEYDFYLNYSYFVNY